MNERIADVSVVIPCYSENRWEQLLAAIGSTLEQVPRPKSVIVSVDRNRRLFDRLSNLGEPIEVVLNEGPAGASSTRNAGAAVVKTPIIAFIDDDATAHPGWLANLMEPFYSPDVVGTGGFAAARWSVPKPRWFPDEFAWAVGASFRGLPTSRTPVRNVWSENMAVRRSSFEKVGGFRVDFTKVGNVSRSDDTDLCIRMERGSPGGKWIYVPEAVVNHYVGAERARFSFFLARNYSEGRAKIELLKSEDGPEELVNEQDYFRRTLPRGLAEYLRNGFKCSDLDDFRRAGALLAGAVAAGCGAMVALIKVSFELHSRKQR